MPFNNKESNTKSPNTNDVSETYTVIENYLNAAIYNESNSKPTLLVCEATKYSQESFDGMCKREWNSRNKIYFWLYCFIYQKISGIKNIYISIFLGLNQHDPNHGLDEQDVKLDIAVEDYDAVEEDDEVFYTNLDDDRCSTCLIVVIILMIISLCIYSMMYLNDGISFKATFTNLSDVSWIMIWNNLSILLKRYI